MSIPIYGNYHGYYSKRPTVNDARLSALPEALFHGAIVLDIGCNEGWVTCEIAQSLGPHKVIGVDIDDTLVQAAWRRRRTVWSLQGPSPATTSTTRRRNYFPLSCEHEFGSLPIPPSTIRGKHAFPHNVSFRTANWIRDEIPEDAEGYDVVVAFSVSKWIHLNEGDEGLRQFFRKVHSVLKTGGAFVLEPQPWESYAKARRMSEAKNAKNLVIRPEHFSDILRDIGFESPRHFGSIGEGGEWLLIPHSS
ncbi:uncharacterized protein LACBIDRAFT_248725 [Laccaria bicolor S238N-H82]|uniref:RNA methyltransferase n=1 Tax=Laccaria bicolor (strain S238N-H82 / ATCC MYA-4686) TaxID=486041 RepID=B0D6P1_LACBS|nr:uncharacterized protein LACBIDRAFT_248725 [Laccaria bicolor S238N-H82]EDR09258.1 predicted protein [Laccaria bicolor S238N-H82]|eukprot:XP_001879607.1 predicted protein [Laccaria bicolor S238N-H82]